jgi:hypothetical protein
MENNRLFLDKRVPSPLIIKSNKTEKNIQLTWQKVVLKNLPNYVLS